MITPPLVIYHANCADGFTAAWVAHRALGDADLFPAHYGDKPPVVTDRDVYIVDFSYPREDLLRMHGDAKSLVVLDHHKTAEEDLAGLEFCTFDMNECGASLAWKHFHDRAPLDLIHYIRDRDLWLWERESSREVNAWIRSFGFSLERWDFLVGALQHHHAWTDAVLAGVAILRAQKKLVDAYVRHGMPKTLHNYKGKPVEFRVVNCAADGLISEVATDLAAQTGAGAAWFMRSDGQFQWSLRGDRRPGVDISSVAKRYGGGGHRNAAGFSRTPREMSYLMGWGS